MDDRSQHEHSSSTVELLASALADARSRPQIHAKMQRLLGDYGVQWLRNASVAELHGLLGLTQQQAERLHAITTLTTRLANLEVSKKRIETGLDAVLLLYPQLAHLDHEEFRVLVLDNKNHVTANLLLYIGTANEATVSPSEVFRPAIVRNAHRVIVAHNHPSLDPDASTEDIELTKRLIEAGEILDIDLLDHLIIGGHPLRYTSIIALLSSRQSQGEE
jgi:DNA repair protein RadC